MKESLVARRKSRECQLQRAFATVVAASPSEFDDLADILEGEAARATRTADHEPVLACRATHKRRAKQYRLAAALVEWYRGTYRGQSQ